MSDSDQSNKIWIDGPMHPDLFDGETPIRELVDLDAFGLRVYEVECTYYVQEEQTHFVVASDASKAEDIAWERVQEEPTGMDSAEVKELGLDDKLTKWSHSLIVSTNDTARQLLVKHIEEHGCKPQEPELFHKD